MARQTLFRSFRKGPKVATRIKAEPVKGMVWSVGSLSNGTANAYFERAEVGTTVANGEVSGSVAMIVNGDRCYVSESQAASLAKALVEALIVRQRIDAAPALALDEGYLDVAPSTAAAFASRLMMGHTIPELEEGE